MRFDLVTLFVEDPHAVAGWYRDHLGLVTLEETERFVRLDGGEGAKIAFHGVSRSETRATCNSTSRSPT